MSTAPYPRVTVPESRQKVHSTSIGSAITNCDFDENVIRAFFSILRKHVPVSALIKYSAILQLKLRLSDTSGSIFFHKPSIRIFCLWVLVESLHVGVSRGGVKVVVTLLTVFTMVPFSSG